MRLAFLLLKARVYFVSHVELIAQNIEVFVPIRVHLSLEVRSFWIELELIVQEMVLCLLQHGQFIFNFLNLSSQGGLSLDLILELDLCELERGQEWLHLWQLNLLGWLPFHRSFLLFYGCLTRCTLMGWSEGGPQNSSHFYIFVLLVEQPQLVHLLLLLPTQESRIELYLEDSHCLF